MPLRSREYRMEYFVFLLADVVDYEHVGVLEELRC